METIKKIFGKLGDIVAVSAWCFVCCLPVFTAGASISALYYAVNKSVCNNRGYVSQEFFRSFKNNFKVTTPGWLIHFALFAVFAIDFYLTRSWQAGWSRILFMALFVILIFATASWAVYFQAYVARFDDGLKLGLINSGKLALAGFAKIHFSYDAVAGIPCGRYVFSTGGACTSWNLWSDRSEDTRANLPGNNVRGGSGAGK